MKVTKQQKVLGGVLVLGMVALAMDRFVFSTATPDPSTSDVAKSEYAVAPGAASPGAKPQPSAGPAQGSQISLAQRLRTAGQGLSDNSTRDAFALPASWVVQGPAAPTERLAEKFRQAHRLNGVLASGEHTYAMVDSTIVVLGQSLDGFKLTNISHRTAVFERDGERATLNMSDGGASGSLPVAGVNP